MSEFKINPDDWKFYFSRNMSVFLSYLSAEGVREYRKDFEIDKTVERICIGKGMYTDNFFLLPTIQDFGKAVMEKALKDKNYIRRLEEKIILRSKKLQEVSDQVKNFRGSIDKKEKVFKKYCEVWKSLAPTLWITMVLGKSMNDLLVKELRERLKEKYSQEELEILISEVTYTEELTPMMKEEMDLLKIGIEVQKNKKYDYQKALKNHFRKYMFIPVNYADEPWDYGFFEKQLNQFLKEYDCEKRFNELKYNHEEKVRKRKKILDRGIFEEKELLEIEILKSTTYLNELRKFSYCKANFYIRKFFDFISEGTKLGGWRDMFHLLPSEVLEIIGGKESGGHLDSVNGRKEIYAILRDSNEKLHVLEGKEAENIKSKMIYPGTSKKIKEQRQIEGTIASVGKIRGVVKILKTVEDMEKVNRGDVIVAEMTTVEFVPVMRLASAFVTDSGGITCHAAIVARELGIPCLVGTQISTSVLKDGDYVEVDAQDKGIVKILDSIK